MQSLEDLVASFKELLKPKDLVKTNLDDVVKDVRNTINQFDEKQKAFFPDEKKQKIRDL